MNESDARPSPDPHWRVGHETTDASAYYVSLFALGLTLIIALVLLFLYWLFWRFEATVERSDPPTSPVASDGTPPAPRLQVHPSAELIQLRHSEDTKLASYQWIDQRQGVVRIPIDRAIELLAERGLPEPEPVTSTDTKQESAP